jgi:hypothetical protein
MSAFATTIFVLTFFTSLAVFFSAIRGNRQED